ncbi:MAG TPA: pyridoxamine 5'-phosphate oxidase family protein [Candidatus Binatia bacterium]|nr:pyridoxamine 5'-phosphate oxidase family protein [Candidatus Binatia bacterium]
MQNKYQEQFGYPIPRTAGKVRPFMAEWIQEFIRHSPFCVMATSNSDGDCDASPKGGTPGFVKVLNDKQLFIPDVAGNKLFHGYGNIESNPKVGLIFLIPGHNQTVRINGRAKVIGNAELSDAKLEVHDPDENAKVLQGLLIDVEESYSHCPRALKFSKLWDVEEISKNIAQPPLPPKQSGI